MASSSVPPPENQDLDSVLRENRVFQPPAEFAKLSHVKSLADYEARYKKSIEDPEAFWAEAARELDWFEPWTKCSTGISPGPSGSSAASST